LEVKNMMTVCRVHMLRHLPWALALVAVSVAVLAACSSEGDGAGDSDQPGGDGYRGMVLKEPLEKPAFTLPDTSGTPFEFAKETEGYVTFLYFGYTYCPDICPGQIGLLAGALKNLPEDVTSRVKVVFVTADPARDTPERLREWLDNFGATFVGLVPQNQERVNDISFRALGALGGLWAPITNEDLPEGGYAVSHPAMLIAYTTDNLAPVIYPFGVTREVFEEDLPKLVKQGGDE
jgi:protein SCO1